LGTFSKALAPGMRVGGAVAPHAVREKLVVANEAAVLTASTFSQTVIAEYLSTADRRGQLDVLRGPDRVRRDASLGRVAAQPRPPRTFSQTVIAEYLSTADWRGQIDVFRGVYRERRDAMVGALAEQLPSLSWTVPDGGFYVWLRLPAELDSKAMLPRAVKE